MTKDSICALNASLSPGQACLWGGESSKVLVDTHIIAVPEHAWGVISAGGCSGCVCTGVVMGRYLSLSVSSPNKP